jgi:Malectin domain/Malectin-like domain
MRKSLYYCKCLALLLSVSLTSLLPLHALGQSDPTRDYPTFHRNPQRTGWIPSETKLTPANVRGGQFGALWNSPAFDSVSVGGTIYPPRMYASPLYIDVVTLSAGKYAGQHVSMVVAATSNGYVYAVNAFARNDSAVIPAGYIFWSTKLADPASTKPTGPEILAPTMDGGVPLGVMGTPVIDVSTSPGRLYVASDDVTEGWLVYALDITSGKILPGWPVAINNTTLSPVNRNGPTTFQASSAMSQRGALNLSPDGRYLYVPFAGYSDGGAGWIVLVDTLSGKLASAFAGAPNTTDKFANAGIWSSAGAAVDTNGVVYATTGNGTTQDETTRGYWGQSVLQWGPGSPLTLTGTYTPFNYCDMDKFDTDLAGGGPVVVPDLGSTNTSTPHLLAFGGKQGNMYLLDRDHMPGSLTNRPGCYPDVDPNATTIISTGSTNDRSLLPPGTQPQFGIPGPINIFGPYSENYTDVDNAKSRSTPAYFQAADGTSYLFATGSTKKTVSSTITAFPCVTRLKIVKTPGKPAYLAIDAMENSITMLSPGSPVITSNGSSNAIIWVLVGNVLRTDSLLLPNTPHPILYAFDQDLNILWNSTQMQLNAGGKYMTPVFARGTVFVGTDRIQAFGLGSQVVSPSEVAINSGGGVAGVFSADMDFTGGHADSYTNPVDVTGVVNPAPQAVYQTKRTGSNGVGFTYVIPQLTVGRNYNVRLHFVESSATGTGGRLFNVVLNGNTVLPNFDIFAAAGAQFKAVIKEFVTTPNSTGNIVIAYNYGSALNPIANGIEVIPIASGISINSGGAAAGTFVADTDFAGGHADTVSGSIDTSGVSNPAPLAVYLSKRTGNGPGQGFSYTIPNLTAGHAYTVRLHFVESSWTSSGQRVFDVTANGQTLLRNFDIFAAAGASFKANVQQFQISPDTTGTIVLNYLAGSIGNPLSSGIEVIP